MLVTLGVVLLALTSCSNAPQEGSRTGPAAATSLDAIRQSSAEQVKVIHEATEAGVVACMASRGFTYKAAPYDTGGATEEHRWGDVEEARRSGYGFAFSSQPDGGRPPSGAEDQTAGMSAAQQAAWNGALSGGADNPDAGGQGSDVVSVTVGDTTTSFSKSSCRTYGTEQVQGDSTAWIKAERRVEDLGGEASHRAEADPRMTDLVQKWAACMAGRGYRVKNRDEARGLVADRVRSGALSAAKGRADEIAVATADAECAASLGADAIVKTVDEDAEKAVVAANENDVLAFQELQKNSLVRAQAIAQRS